LSEFTFSVIDRARPTLPTPPPLAESVGPKTLKLNLLKEIRQRPAARKSRRLIGGKATAIDPHAHRFWSMFLMKR
jgi:hypothetical protein